MKLVVGVLYEKYVLKLFDQKSPDSKRFQELIEVNRL